MTSKTKEITEEKIKKIKHFTQNHSFEILQASLKYYGEKKLQVTGVKRTDAEQEIVNSLQNAINNRLRALNLPRSLPEFRKFTPEKLQQLDRDYLFKINTLKETSAISKVMRANLTLFGRIATFARAYEEKNYSKDITANLEKLAEVAIKRRRNRR